MASRQREPATYVQVTGWPNPAHGFLSCERLPASAPLEELYRSLVFLRGGQAAKRAEVLAAASLRILLAGVQPILPGFELPDHVMTLPEKFSSVTSMQLTTRAQYSAASVTTSDRGEIRPRRADPDCQGRSSQLPFVDDPGARRNSAEPREATGVESAQFAGVDEAEIHLAQLGCRLIHPDDAADVGQVPSRYRLE